MRHQVGAIHNVVLFLITYDFQNPDRRLVDSEKSHAIINKTTLQIAPCGCRITRMLIS